MAIKNNTVTLLAEQFNQSRGTKRRSQKTVKMALFLEDECAKNDKDAVTKPPQTPSKSKKPRGTEGSSGVDVEADSPAKSTRSKKHMNPLAETQKLQAVEYFQRKKTLQSSQKARRTLPDLKVINVTEQEEQTISDNELQQPDQPTGPSPVRQQSTPQQPAAHVDKQPNSDQQQVHQISHSQPQTSQQQPDTLQQQLPCLLHQQQQISQQEPTSCQQPNVRHQLPGPSTSQKEPMSCQQHNIRHQLSGPSLASVPQQPQQSPISRQQPYISYQQSGPSTPQHLSQQEPTSCQEPNIFSHQLPGPSKPQLFTSLKQLQPSSQMINLQPPFNDYPLFHQQPVQEEQNYWSGESQSLSSAVADGLGTINSACDMCEGYRKRINFLEAEMEQLKQENKSLKEQKGMDLYRDLKDLVDKYGRDDTRSPSPVLSVISSSSLASLRSPLASPVPETSSRSTPSSMVSPKAAIYNSEPVADVLESVEGHKTFIEPGENKIKLVDGYSLYIDATKLQAMKSKAKKNPTKLLRELLSYFFTEEYLSAHSATGAKSAKKGLPSEIIQPIREFMSKHYKYEDTNIVVNRKSLDLTRKILKVKK